MTQSTNNIKKIMFSIISGLLLGFIVPYLLWALYININDYFYNKNKKTAREIVVDEVKLLADDYGYVLTTLKRNPDFFPINNYKKSFYFPFEETKNSELTYPFVSDLTVTKNYYNNSLGFSFVYNGVVYGQIYRTLIFQLHEDIIKPKNVQNEQLLKNYTATIEDKKNEVKTMTQTVFENNKDNDKSLLKPNLTIPNIKGKLPQTKKELNEYLTWISKIEGYDTPDELLDLYGTQIRFEIVTNGLKAISAGEDKTFDTLDDLFYINKTN